ncbi:YitT family protein [Paenibacillus dendritiformis]|uniref:YitT family protein n=1 Tax=Paenibacillus dendritiformis TaxID=130049 RepID=UPI00248A9FF2|nr:YitT family protein [Paenibacillus dendritiformis]WGU96890.1 YitT family protein [Paenibacillus dendritiformis]
MRKNEQLRHIVWMLLGSMLLAFSYYHINFQNHLAEGGFVGLALIGKYTFDWSPALTVLMLDIPVFIAAWFFQGRRFIMNTAMATGVFSLTYELCERYSPWVMNFGSNMVLAAVVSGVLTGFAAGIVLRHGGATGGDDIVALFISRWTKLSVGTVFIIIDIVVLLVSLFYLPLWDTLYTILAVSIGGKVITWIVQAGVPRRAVPVRSQTAVHHQHG